MIGFIAKFVSPLISLGVIMLGNGLLNVLVPVRLEQEGATVTLVGAMWATYALGQILGAFRIDPFITRVGHIRAYAVFASAVAASTLALGFTFDATIWLLLRFITGFCTSGLFLIIESWLLSGADKSTRGRLLSIYMITLYGCQSAGSLLLDLFSIESVLHFTTAAILSSLSVIPLSMTRAKDPKLEEPDALSIYNLYKISPTGVLGCFSAGMITGSIYGLHPYFLRAINFEAPQVALIMFATVFGAGALQYPVGRFSDSFDRRRVMVVMAILSGVCSFIISFTDPSFFKVMLVVSFFLGGFCFTLYPISINHACDSIDSKAILAATQGLLFAYSIGSSFGPLISSAVMQIMGPRGMFVFFMALTGFLALFFQWRSRQRPIEENEKQDFVNVTSTTPISIQIERDELEKDEK